MTKVFQELRRVQAVVCGDNADYDDGKSSSEEDANASGTNPSEETKRAGESNGSLAASFSI